MFQKKLMEDILTFGWNDPVQLLCRMESPENTIFLDGIIFRQLWFQNFHLTKKAFWQRLYLVKAWKNALRSPTKLWSKHRHLSFKLKPSSRESPFVSSASRSQPDIIEQGVNGHNSDTQMCQGLRRLMRRVVQYKVTISSLHKYSPEVNQYNRCPPPQPNSAASCHNAINV